MSGHNPVHCILPPHILRHIATNGTPGQREYALRNMSMAERMRGERRASAQMVGLMALAATDVRLRTVYDARQGATLPGTIVRKEGDPPVADPTINEAYDGAGATYDFYKEIYGRNSIDNAGLHLISTVHYQKGYDNAFWNGQQMIYGDGDEDLPVEERLFNRFTVSVDIIGHELTHGVTQYEAALVYYEQAGAFNESLSDVFGSLVKQHQRGETADRADWIIGQGLLTTNVSGVGLRSMKEPGTAYDDPILGKDPQPAHMQDLVQTAADSGGVHINSGIPNRAFYLTAIELGGFAWEKAGLIWYIALKNKLGPKADFQEAANQTFQAAGDQFGAGSLEQQAVRTGWAGVGLNAEAPAVPDAGQPQGDGCLPALLRTVGLAR